MHESERKPTGVLIAQDARGAVRAPGGADVLAIALRYRAGEDAAPVVTAKGRGHMAEQILSLAFTHGVKVRQDADLAQILSAVEPDSPIPLEAFAAVAEILTYLYKVNRIYGRAAQTPTADRQVPDGAQ